MQVLLEVQRKDNLHFLVDEMVRWRGIIDDYYKSYKLSLKAIVISVSTKPAFAL